MTDRGFFPRSDRGSVAVEAALLIPAVFLVLWLFATAAFSWRLEGATHRATAALADMLANQRTGTSETLPERLERMAPQLGSMFLEMVTGESSEQGTLRSQMQYGVLLTYYNSLSGSEIVFENIGNLGCSGPSASLKVLGTAGGDNSLVTENNYGGLQLLQVKACVRYSGMIVDTVVMPREFSSSFIAVRREE